MKSKKIEFHLPIKNSQLVPYQTSITYTSKNIQQLKPAKYDYMAGIYSGFILSASAYIKGMLEAYDNKEPTDKVTKTAIKHFRDIIKDNCEQLVKQKHWRFEDLKELSDLIKESDT